MKKNKNNSRNFLQSGSWTSILAAMLVLIVTPGYSQDAEMADVMRSEGKIYVVISIVLVILGGLIAYLVMIDRKASRLEKKLDQNRPA